MSSRIRCLCGGSCMVRIRYVKGELFMKVQVRNEGMIYLPAQAMAAFSIREQDILDCSLTQTGILLTPIFLAESMAGVKKN